MTAATFEPEDDMTRNEASAILRRELDELPEGLRLPLVLHYIGGESAPEIGKRLGITAATARKRLQLARDRLRRGDLSRLMPALALLGPPPGLLDRIMSDPMLSTLTLPSAAHRASAVSISTPASFSLA